MSTKFARFVRWYERPLAAPPLLPWRSKVALFMIAFLTAILVVFVSREQAAGTGTAPLVYSTPPPPTSATPHPGL